MRAPLFADHRHVNVYIHMLNFRSWSQPQNYFNSKIFLIYGTYNYYQGEPEVAHTIESNQ